MVGLFFIFVFIRNRAGLAHVKRATQVARENIALSSYIQGSSGVVVKKVVNLGIIQGKVFVARVYDDDGSYKAFGFCRVADV